jgi:hypothetical protein
MKRKVLALQQLSSNAVQQSAAWPHSGLSLLACFA